MAILSCLRSGKPTSRPEIAIRTGLAPATVNRLVTSLIDAGLVVTSGASEDTGGRPSLLVRFNETAAVTLALDIGDDYTDVALMDLGARVLTRIRVPEADTTPENRLLNVLDFAEREMRSATLAGYRCVALGASVPGPVQLDGTVDFAPSIGWHDVPLGRLLMARLALPVVVDNDANLIAVAERSHGSGRGCSSLIAIAVFNGIGAGIIVNGQLWQGAKGGAGQIGRMLLEPTALRRSYPGFGDLEQRLGNEGLVRRAAEESVGPLEGGALIESILKQVESGSKPARVFLDRIFDEFAVALINVCAILEPQMIVFSGTFARWSEEILPELRQRMMGQVLHMPELAAASLEFPALVGAAEVAFQRFGSVEKLVDRQLL